MKKRKKTAPSRPRPAGRARRGLVPRKLQQRFTLLLLVQVAFLWILLFVFTRLHISTVQGIVRDVPVTSQSESLRLNEALSGVTWHFYLGALGLGALAVGCTVLIGLTTSDKLAAPCARLRQYAGEPVFGTREKPMVFRRRDRLEDVASALNETGAAIEQRRREISGTLGALAARTRTLGGVSSPERADVVVGEMEDLIRTLTAWMESSVQS